tara:strand:+ start:1418 stop:1885 length:468 start_codon:yes stop_codon:yes gene_type:complete
MAISRGPGTEIIRTACFEAIAGVSSKNLIIGVQHHIYTVLSIIVTPAGAVAGSKFSCHILGYDSFGGATGQIINVFITPITEQKTFVWNDKFSFNGYEPVNFGTGGITSAPLSAADQQDAIADQGSSVAQKLQCYTLQSGDSVDVTITYIDQNNE